ncbi:MAG: hypothetical protein AAB483_04290 [Patescibacteria group bacterium]
MSEIITTYPLDNLEKEEPMDRVEFYKAQVEAHRLGRKPTRAAGIVNIFLFNSRGELLVQKRSFEKNHNPGMLDKSMGGHMTYGNSPDYSVMVETVQELQTPSIVLRSDSDFKKTLVLLREYLSTIAIVEHVQTKAYTLNKIIDGVEIPVVNKVFTYFGLYDGRVRPADQEAKGILFYTLPELDREMEKFPETFTHDLHVFMKDLRSDMEKFLESL